MTLLSHGFVITTRSIKFCTVANTDSVNFCFWILVRKEAQNGGE